MIHLATREEPLPMKVLERSLFDGAQSAKTLENFFFLDADQYFKAMKVSGF